MNRENYQKAKEIFHRALERPPTEREQFLAEACADDQILLQDVKNLLATYQTDFLEQTALAEVADSFADVSLYAIGQKIGRYEIRGKLGAGGMGEVFLAYDKELKRLAAIKVLHDDVASDTERVRRFLQEARAASALNHPNILTIYEVGESDGRRFIASEYVAGETLRERIRRDSLTFEESLKIAVQVAAALNVAHTAGIIHRDIKPENVMLREDGLIKVLDFGLAKLSEGKLDFLNTEASTFAQVQTKPGLIMGTAAYMSPEQTRGIAVDHRSDIWSLGVTLYEMVTGQTPFKGQTTSDLIVSILEREPVPITQLTQSVPKKLDDIVKRCLSKNADFRYQTSADLSQDLRNVPQQFELNDKALHIARGGGDLLENKSPRDLNQRTKDDLLGSKITQNQLSNAITNKSRFVYLNQFKKWQLVSAIVLLILLGGIIASNSQISLFKNVNWFGSNSSAKPFQHDHTTRLTTTGNALFANVSPDGKYVAYVTQDADKQSLWIRQTASAPPKPLIPGTENFYVGLTFSPDSNFIYYVAQKKALGVGVLYEISTLGGESRKIIEDVDSPITFAPDGKRFGFMRGFYDNGVNSNALLIANLGNQTTQKLAVHRDPVLFAPEGFAWSPDGKTIIAATTKISDSNTKEMSLVEIQISDGSERAFTGLKWQDIGRVAWLGNKQQILMTTFDVNLTQPQIVQISYPEGEIQSVTKNLTGYSSVSATNDGRGIVAIESDRISHIWTAPADNLAQIKRITPAIGRYYQPSWTPDNKIIYVSEEDGNQDVWTMNADGSNAKKLTFDKSADYKPLASPNGQYIVFTSKRGGTDQVWRMDWNGSNLLQLTNGNEEIAHDISLDNKLVYYATYNFGKSYLWSIPVDGGHPTRMFDFQTTYSSVSPDGKRIVCWFLNEQTNASWQFGIAPINGGEIIKSLNISIDNVAQIANWAPNGQDITYTSALDDLHNIWNYPLNGKLPKQLTNFDSSNQILYFSWSRDGKNLVCLRGSKPNDVVYLKADNN